jgi:hypothetical protein
MRREGREQQLCFLQLHPAQEDIMSELEMKIDMEVEDFTDELSDEAVRSKNRNGQETNELGGVG